MGGERAKMFCRYSNCVIVLSIIVGSFLIPAPQDDTGWRISPEKLNIHVGDDRPLQVLDDSAQELHGTVWSVDNEDIAELREEEGLQVLHAKAAGVVVVTALLGGKSESREIKIWPMGESFPAGTPNWTTHDIGKEIDAIAAVPSSNGPNVYSLEQTEAGSAYLRAFASNGIQLWSWLMPEDTRDLELVCGDWLGGAVISANRAEAYTLYFVGNDGKLRWQHNVEGLRKGLAIDTNNSLYLLSQSVDGTVTDFAAFDEASGEGKFELQLPASVDKHIGFQKQGTTIVCGSFSESNLSRITASGVYVNMDGFPYVAFTQKFNTIGITACTPGAVVNPREMYLEQDEKLVLWQIHRDGTYRSTVLEEINKKQTSSDKVYSVSAPHTIVTDNMSGMLVPAQWSDGTTTDDFVYRVAEDGQVVYKLAMPKFAGPSDDGMVIGGHDVAFATRGGTLIAFDERIGKDLWHWNSNTAKISVFAALANGHCLVQTPTALVEVISSTESKELAKGKARMDWHGQLYMQLN